MITEQTISPLESAVAELRREGAALAECDQAIAQFKRAHMCVLNGVVSFRSDRASGRGELDAELRVLLRARDKVWQRHQSAMAEHARIKLGGAR